MTRTERLQGHIHAAVLRDDMRSALRIYVENRLSRAAFDDALAQARKARADLEAARREAMVAQDIIDALADMPDDPGALRVLAAVGAAATPAAVDQLLLAAHRGAMGEAAADAIQRAGVELLRWHAEREAA
jgi:hypothetical protein